MGSRVAVSAKVVAVDGPSPNKEMQLISFDPLRTWDMPGVVRLKPEQWQQSLPQIRAADWVLFPEHWQVNFLAYALRKRIFPSVSSYHLGYSKVEMTYAFQSVCPEHVPHTRILPRTESSTDEVLAEFAFPFVAKEVRNSMGRGVFLVENRDEWDEYLARNSMLYVQECLPLTRDVRVVVVGRQVLAAYWRTAAEGGFHNNVARGGEISFEAVPDTAVSLALQVATTLDIDHAGFDVALVDGHPYLLEFNMRFGNEALRKKGIRLGQHIRRYLEERTAVSSTTALA